MTVNKTLDLSVTTFFLKERRIIEMFGVLDFCDIMPHEIKNIHL